MLSIQTVAAGSVKRAGTGSALQLCTGAKEVRLIYGIQSLRYVPACDCRIHIAAPLGSIRTARRAGIQHAAIATITNKIAAVDWQYS